MENNPLYSIVVPVFRSGNTLIYLADRIDELFEKIEGDYELILVEDCGGDRSWQIMNSLHCDNNKVKIIRLMRNFGQHNALMCGLSFAEGTAVISMDDDLQNPPEEIPKLIEALHADDFDVVYGIPEKRRHSLVRNMGSAIYYRLISFLFPHFPDFKMSNFRIMRKEVVDQILHYTTPNPLVGLLLLKVTEKIGALTVDHHGRFDGKSTYTFFKLSRHLVRPIIIQGSLWLQGVFLFANVCLCAFPAAGISGSFLFAAESASISGWIGAVILTLLFAGVILFSLGLIGTYIYCSLQEVSGKPQYLVKEKKL